MNTPVQSSCVEHLYIPGAVGSIHALGFGTDLTRPPLLLLHGVTGSAWLWHDVAATLQDKRRIIALDLRGHGQSDWSDPTRYTTEHHVHDLEAAIRYLGGQPVHMAGLSWGALIGMACAARNPGLIERLAIVDVEPSFDLSETAVPQRPHHFHDVDEAFAWERQANPAAPDKLLSLWTRQSLRHATQGGWKRQHDPFFHERWPFRQDDLWGSLAKLEMPVLLVNGKRSFVREKVMRQMADKIPNSRFEQIPDSGHLVPLEAPGHLSALLEKFFLEA